MAFDRSQLQPVGSSLDRHQPSACAHQRGDIAQFQVPRQRSVGSKMPGDRCLAPTDRLNPPCQPSVGVGPDFDHDHGLSRAVGR